MWKFLKTMVVAGLGRVVGRWGYHLQKSTVADKVSVSAPSDVFAIFARDLMARRQTEGLRFVQIGANDGVRFDPTRALVVRHGWSGLLVEPQPQVFETLKRNYAGNNNLEFECAAIGAACGTLTLFGFDPDAPGAQDMSGLACSQRAVVENNIFDHRAPIREFVVPLLTPSALLEKHGIKQFDVLQIDAEGMDDEILLAFDFDRWKPLLIQFEHSGLTPDMRAQVYQRLQMHGYRLALGTIHELCGTAIDTIAYLPEAEPISQVNPFVSGVVDINEADFVNTG